MSASDSSAEAPRASPWLTADLAAPFAEGLRRVFEQDRSPMTPARQALVLRLSRLTAAEAVHLLWQLPPAAGEDGLRAALDAEPRTHDDAAG